MAWLILLLAAYAALAAAVYGLQDHLLFPGAGRGSGEPLPAVQGVRVTELDGAQGRFRIAVGEPPGPARGVLLFFLGNGEDLRSGVAWAGDLACYELVTVVPEYPGFGDSEGKPSYAALMANADVAREFAADLAAKRGVPLLAGGSSLGTFSAVRAASGDGVERLLLLAPPTSIAEAGSRHYPWLPVRWLLRHPFDNLGAAAAVRCPVLVLHGDADEVVPVDMGRRVAAALGAELIIAPGGRHTGAPLSPNGPFAARIRDFLVGAR